MVSEFRKHSAGVGGVRADKPYVVGPHKVSDGPFIRGKVDATFPCLPEGLELREYPVYGNIPDPGRLDSSLSSGVVEW